MSDFLYGQLNEKVEKESYKGQATATANTVLDSTTNTFTVNVSRTPGTLRVQKYDGTAVYNGSSSVTVDVPGLILKETTPVSESIEKTYRLYSVLNGVETPVSDSAVINLPKDRDVKAVEYKLATEDDVRQSIYPGVQVGDPYLDIVMEGLSSDTHSYIPVKQVFSYMNIANGTGAGSLHQSNVAYSGTDISPTASGVGATALGVRTAANAMGSVAEGSDTVAGSDYSHVEGYLSKTIVDTTDPDLHGRASHAEGSHTTAIGSASHAEGSYTTATGLHSHTEGYRTDTIGNDSHAEGNNTHTNNLGEHAEGCYNVSRKNSDTYGDALNTQHSIGIGTANVDPETGMFDTKNAVEVMQNGDMYIIGVGGYDGKSIENADTIQDLLGGTTEFNLENGEGENSVQQKIDNADSEFYMPGSARPEISHVPTELDRVEGTDSPYETGAFGKNSAMLGRRGRVEGGGSVSVGNRNLIKSQNGFASGNANIINADNAMVGGSLNRVDGPTSMSVGYNNYVNGEQSFSTGMGNKESSNRSVMAGKANENEGSESFVAGTGNTNNGTGSVISGYGNENEASNSIVSGLRTSNTGNKSIVSGNSNTNSGEDSIVSGYGNTNSAQKTIVVGRDSTSTGEANAVFGYDSHAYGTGDFVAGWSTVTGNYSGGVGYGVKVSHNNSFAIGKYNVDNQLLVFAVGMGTNDTNRLDAFEVYTDGHAEVRTQGNAPNSVVIKSTLDSISGGTSLYRHVLTSPSAGQNAVVFIATTDAAFTDSNALQRMQNGEIISIGCRISSGNYYYGGTFSGILGGRPMIDITIMGTNYNINIDLTETGYSDAITEL